MTKGEPPMSQWGVEDSTQLYRLDQWGMGYFWINDRGHVCVRPVPDCPNHVDLMKLVEELHRRKVRPPYLIRVMDILKDRLDNLAGCFRHAMDATQYKGRYHPLFPIKVNQQRHVVEAILRYGKPHGLGLEAGSKAELLAILPLAEDERVPIVCNGYKDREFVELVGMAHKMGKSIFPVIEKVAELETFIAHYHETGIMPKLGFRLKLSTRGSGPWAATGGESSKFGLRVSEILDAVNRLKQEGLLDNLKLIHFHLGSQISQIKVIKQALVETGRIFVEMVKLGAPLEYVDVGGGLGVDYEGTSLNTYASINYNPQEYANDVVYRIQQLCDDAGIPHPTIFTESGRFLSAHYSMLITNISTQHEAHPSSVLNELPKSVRGPLAELLYIVDHITDANYLESYHDALLHQSELLNLFNLGYLSLVERAAMEQLVERIMDQIAEKARALGHDPVELAGLNQRQTDTRFANLSMFQSLPDAWAIRQLFPILPIHHLEYQPTRKSVIVDLTCDSDGCIKDYLGEGQRNSHVLLHQVKPGDPYYIGIFLVGAYQETLGELHNLFGDTHAVQIEIQGENQYRIMSFLRGDSVKDVLGFFSYNSSELIACMRDQVENALEQGALSLEESAQIMEQYEQGMHGYTYFED